MEFRHGRRKMDPILLVGTLLAVASGVFFYVKDDIKTGLSVIAGLMVTLLTLQVQVLLREGERTATRNRYETLIAEVEKVDWLHPIVHDLARSAFVIDNKYRKTAAVGAGKRLLKTCAAMLQELEQGHLTTELEDASLLVAEADRCRTTMRATSLQTVDASWWKTAAGAKYWEANLRAISRGVSVERIFIYTEWSSGLNAMVIRHANAGVRARKVRVDVLPAQLRKDIIIWDSSCGYESQFNPHSGESINFFTLNQADIERMESDYRTIYSLANDVDKSDAERI